MSRAKKIWAFLAVGLVGVGALFAGQIVSVMVHMGGGSPITWWNRIRNPRREFAGRDRVYVLLIGKDYNRDKRGMPYTKGARSDTLLLLSLDLANRQVSALSIPRDTYVPLPDTGGWGKINGAYARGDAPLAMQTVGQLLGVAPDYYVALKPDAVQTIVDNLGGVEVEALDRMKYDDSWGQLHIDLPAGKQTLNGAQAVGFTRYRKPNPGLPESQEDGDDRRMARQQMLLKAIAQKAKTPQMLPRADKLIEASLQAIETNLTRPQIFALAVIFKDVQPQQMQTASVMGEIATVGKLSVFRPNPDKLAAQVDWLLRGNEASAYALTVVTVRNGTRVRGAARQVADLLRDQGFDVQSMGNAKQTAEVPQTKILYGKAIVESRARHIALLLGGGTLFKRPAESLEGADVTVVLGRDVAPSFATKEARL